jgi:anthranilate phosphoribosyltransferase
VSEGKAGIVSSYFIEPKNFGLERVRLKDLSGGAADENARITRDVLGGRKGAKRDIVCLNAAPALVAGRRAKTLQEGFALAGRVIESGAAMEKLERLIQFTNKK